jgi:uncharacterized membrane protein
VNRPGRLEELLAAFLRDGCWLALSIIGLGYALALISSYAPASRLPVPSSTPIVRLGIALLILLPIIRVVLMLAVFARERNFRFAFISGAVLAIILLGIFLGVSAT